MSLYSIFFFFLVWGLLRRNECNILIDSNMSGWLRSIFLVFGVTWSRGWNWLYEALERADMLGCINQQQLLVHCTRL